MKIILAALAATLACAAPASAETITGLTTSNEIFTFDSDTPHELGALKPITGLAGGEKLIAIDRLAFDGKLYGISQTRMYRIDDATAAATDIHGPFPTPVDSSSADLDFNAAGGSTARITTSTGQNIIYSPSTGGELVQTHVSYAPGDVNAAKTPSALGLAFDNNVPGAGTSTAFVYDFANDIVATLPTPNSGQLTTLGASGVVASGGHVGLDISPAGTVYASLRAGSLTQLFTVNKTTGAVTSKGTLGSGADTTEDIATDPVVNDIKFSDATYNVGESDGKVTVTVTRSQGLGQASALLATQNGTAGDDDHGDGSTGIFFSNGQTSATRDISIRSDAIKEGTESFTVKLSQPGGGRAAIASPSTATVQIQDDDNTPPPSTKLTALTTTNGLATFDSAKPSDVSAALPVTGLQSGEELVAIDRRPATGQLYAISKQNRLYTINETSGAATQVGNAPFAPALSGNAWGFDFNPRSDSIRVASNSGGQSLRLNPTTGAAIQDATLAYVAGDPHAGETPKIDGLAYTNNFPGATSTTLFGYEFDHDSIVRIGSPGGTTTSPNTGLTTTIGPAGVSVPSGVNLGFDIDAGGVGFLLLPEATGQRLNLVDLATGQARLVGKVGDGASYRDITAPPVKNVVQVASAASGTGEAEANALVTVVRSQSHGVANVQFATANGSATVGRDYTATSGTLTFADGQTAKAVTIPLLQDTSVEGPETFTLALSNASGGVASLGARSSATVTIADDDQVAKPPADTPPIDTPPSDTPPGDTPPADTPPADTTPAATLAATSCTKRKQRVLRRKAVVACLKANLGAPVRVTGKLKVRGVRKAFKLKAARGTAAAGASKRLKLKLSRKARVALKRAQGKGTVKLKIVVGSRAVRLAATVKSR